MLISTDNSLTNITKVLTRNVAQLESTVTLTLNCQYASGANYSWMRLDSNGNELETIATSDMLEYKLDKNQNPEKWNNFFSSGFTFRCIASTKEPLVKDSLVSQGSMDVEIKGIRTINFGEEQEFFCSENSSTNYIWKVNGQREDQRHGGTEIYAFFDPFPNRVFIECDYPKGNSLANYTVTVCAQDTLQKEHLERVMWYVIPAAFCFLLGLMAVFQSQNVVDRSLLAKGPNEQESKVCKVYLVSYLH